MLKYSLIFSCLLMSGCTISPTAITKEEYVREEKWNWNEEKGLVKNTKATWSFQWK
jgi:hypothetical protein